MTTVTTNGTATLPDGTDSITAIQTFAGAPSPVSTAAAITIDTTRPTLVGTPVINAGTTQTASRSQVRTITWTFSEPVAVVLSNFVLTNRDTNTPVSLASRSISTSGNTVTLTLDNYSVDSGPGLFLADANYELALSPSVADAAGNTLDANGDGAAGETPKFQFYKLFGDFNGDRRSDSTDYLFWSRAYGKSTSDASVDSAYDVNGDGLVSSTDYLFWARSYGNLLVARTDGLVFA